MFSAQRPKRLLAHAPVSVRREYRSRALRRAARDRRAGGNSGSTPSKMADRSSMTTSVVEEPQGPLEERCAVKPMEDRAGCQQVDRERIGSRSTAAATYPI